MGRLRDTQNLLFTRFSDNVSAAQHEECYYEVIKRYTSKGNLEGDWNKFKTISEELSLLLPCSSKEKYQFTGAQEIKILLKPNFLDENDKWIVAFEKMLAIYTKQDPITIVIRISNEYICYSESILQILNSILSNFDNDNIPDVLIDMEYHDFRIESLFLSTIDYFIITNSAQQSLRIKHMLTGGTTLTIEDLEIKVKELIPWI